MSKINLTSIILTAQKELIEKPFDLAHDISHHYRVYEYCLKIIRAEDLNVNYDVLTICSWWHDLEDRKGEKVLKLTTTLKRYECKKDFIKKIIKVIREHSFCKKPTTLEGKILFDADKLEYVNPFRLAWFKQAVKDGFIKKRKYFEYLRQWQERIKKLGKLLNFSYSQKKFIEMLPEAKKIMTHTIGMNVLHP